MNPRTQVSRHFTTIIYLFQSKIVGKIKKIYFFIFYKKNFDTELFEIENSRSISNTGNKISMKNCTTDKVFVDGHFLWAEIRIFTIVFLTVEVVGRLGGSGKLNFFIRIFIYDK